MNWDWESMQDTTWIISVFLKRTSDLLEVSIGHALITESLYLGLDNVINMYLQKLSDFRLKINE
jgi:pyridoxine 5'-phosphate synthase PdxJ